jgi:cell division protein FtsN
MDVDPMESANGAGEASATSDAHRLNTAVALTVALLATFLGLCKVKDDNIVQAMQQAQADKVDQWNFYQARNIREEIAKATVTELQLAEASAPAAQAAAYQRAVARYQALVDEQAQKKAEVERLAKQDEETYDALNYRDDQFDLSDALVAVAISLLAITALTHKRWLFYLALAPTVLGILMGMAGLFGWRIHPDAIARLLS